MCLTAPAFVVSVDGAFAVVEQDGRRHRASLLLLDGVGPGDWLLVGAGTALRRLEADEARELTELLGAARAATNQPSTIDLEPRGALP
ncbi:MAG TPA: HypC/HybG/HupF family hydrogenase formation chaperone [Candidatus Limnocylindrales bacterium]